jgi:hypothetical protein
MPGAVSRLRRSTREPPPSTFEPTPQISSCSTAGSEKERAAFIEERLREWKSAADALVNGTMRAYRVT